MRVYGRKGFTLIELLIVVAIIGILAAIAIPNFLQAQTRARVARSKADIRTMVTATELYYVDNNNYMMGFGVSDPESVLKVYQYFGIWEDALYLLTTPIEYLKELPAKTPFGLYHTHSAPLLLIDGYYYMGPDQWAIRNPNPTAWAFHSTWNDLLFTLNGPGPARASPPSGTGYRFEVYDPTNGTISMGDIWYVKGSSEYHSFH